MTLNMTTDNKSSSKFVCHFSLQSILFNDPHMKTMQKLNEILKCSSKYLALSLTLLRGIARMAKWNVW